MLLCLLADVYCSTPLLYSTELLHEFAAHPSVFDNFSWQWVLWDPGARIRYKTPPHYAVIAEWGVHYRQPSVKRPLVQPFLCRTTFSTQTIPPTTLTFYILG